VRQAILCQSVRKEKKAADGCHIKFFANAVVLLKKKDEPVGTRIKGFISSKVTIKKIVNMSKGVL
jgi:ribosomal protein L14